MSIVVFGDIHFSDERPWSYSVGKEINKYFKQECIDNNEKNVGLFLGDITEKVHISPLVYELLFEFLSSLKFKKTYILMGNHDKKKKRGKIISPLSFLQMDDSPYPNIQVISEPTKLEEEGIPIICLPFKGQSEDENMAEYEAGLDPSWYEMKALVVGHFSDTTNTVIKDSLINLSKFKGEIVLGHIHNPISGHYIGAVVPNSVSEKGMRRFYRVYDSYNKFTPKEIPSLSDYVDISFPKPLTKPSTRIPIYTIYNCQSYESAQKMYPDIFIRKCVYEDLVDSSSFTQTLRLTNETSLIKVVEEWLETQSELSLNFKKKVKEYAETN